MWLAVLTAVGLGALQAPGAPDEEFSMPGIESQKAYDLMQERFPGAAADGATAQVVFVAPDGQKVTAIARKKAIEETVGALDDGSQVAGVTNPFTAQAVSEDGTTAYATVTYKVKSSEVSDTSRTALEKAVDQAREAGLTVETGGSALDSGGGPGGVAEIIGISVAAVVLLITFGSLAAAGLPLLTAILGVGVSMFTIAILANALGLSTSTGTLAMMLGLAVGIDYALFVVSRYREERAKGHAPRRCRRSARPPTARKRSFYTNARTVTAEPNPAGAAQTYTLTSAAGRHVRLRATRLGRPASDEAAKYRLQLAEIRIV